MTQEKLNKVREIVKEKYKHSKFDFWKYHIRPVVENAKLLAKELGADIEVVELGALLHDIGKVKLSSNDEDHHILGISEAEKILKRVGYSDEIINEIKHCVEAHRCNKEDIPPRTLSAKIVANADAMVHFDTFPILAMASMSKSNGDYEKAFEWLYKKIERDWDKKLTLPEAKAVVKEKYKAIKLLMDSTKKVL